MCINLPKPQNDFIWGEVVREDEENSMPLRHRERLISLPNVTQLINAGAKI